MKSEKFIINIISVVLTCMFGKMLCLPCHKMGTYMLGAPEAFSGEVWSPFHNTANMEHI
jgi:hypothetical protein